MTDHIESERSSPAEASNRAVLDCTGLTCPLPLLKTKLALRDLSSGECLRVTTTDPASVRDFRAFIELNAQSVAGTPSSTGPSSAYTLYTLLTVSEVDGHYCFEIKKDVVVEESTAP